MNLHEIDGDLLAEKMGALIPKDLLGEDYVRVRDTVFGFHSAQELLLNRMIALHFGIAGGKGELSEAETDLLPEISTYSKITFVESKGLIDAPAILQHD